MEITQKYLKSLFDYQDGELYWKISNSNRAKIGDRVGTDHGNGYRRVAVNGKDYFVHRLIFLYHRGYLPEFLDHIDDNRSNNDINNLREATMSQNNMNRKKFKSINGKSTSSDFTGVTWNKRAKKWMVYITNNGKQKHLGYFDSETDAAKAYNRAAIERDGKFARLNEV